MVAKYKSEYVTEARALISFHSYERWKLYCGKKYLIDINNKKQTHRRIEMFMSKVLMSNCEKDSNVDNIKQEH